MSHCISRRRRNALPIFIQGGLLPLSAAERDFTSIRFNNVKLSDDSCDEGFAVRFLKRAEDRGVRISFLRRSEPSTRNNAEKLHE